MGNTHQNSAAKSNNNNKSNSHSNSIYHNHHHGRYKQTKLSRLVQQRSWSKALERSERFPNECSEWVRIPSSNMIASSGDDTSGSARTRTRISRKGNGLMGSPASKSSYDNDWTNWVTILPIHQACYLRPPPLFVLTQVQTYPRCVSMQDDYDRMPLHIACMECASLEVIKTLLFWQPRCAMVEDKNGCLPIHLSILAMYKHHPETLIIDEYDTIRTLELLLKAYPEGSCHVNCREDTPLKLFRTTDEILRDRPHYPGRVWSQTIEEVLSRDTKYWRSVRPKEADEIVADYLADKESRKQGLSSFRKLPISPVENAFNGYGSLASTALTRGAQSTSISVRYDEEGETKHEMDQVSSKNNTQLNTWIMLKEWDDVVSCVQNNPEQARKEVMTELSSGESWSRLPLYEACRLNAPVDTIHVIMRAYLDGIRLGESINNRLPLHIACIENLSSDIVKALINEYPDAAKAIESKYSAIPLHFACSNGANVEVVLELLRVYPDGSKVVDKDGWLPLHHACAKGSSSDVIDVLLCSFPEGTSSKELLMGRVPLHFAAMKGVSTTIIEALIKVSPESINAVTFFGSTPLIMAEKNTSSARDAIMKCFGADVSRSEINRSLKSLHSHEKYEDNKATPAIGKLNGFMSSRDWKQTTSYLQLHPKNAAEWIESKLGDGKIWRRLPIHEAIHLKAPLSVISLLVNAHLPGVSSPETLHKRLPLHMACSTGSSLQVIDILLAAYPAGAMIESKDRLLPLHLACANGIGIGVIRSLLNSYPDSTKAKDSDGWLPIHHSCSKGSNSNIVQLLLDSYPESAKVKELSIGRLPIHLASYKGTSVQVIELLLEAYPESVSIGTFTGSTPAALASRSGNKDTNKIVELLSIDASDGSSNDQNLSSPISFDKLKEMIQRSPTRQKQKRLSQHKGQVATDLTVAIVARDWNKAAQIVSDKPEQALVWNEVEFGDGSRWYRLPLHETCRLQPPQQFVDQLVRAYPEGVKKVDHDGWLPLHLACETSASPSVIRLLLNLWPDGARTVESQYGYLPLHVACCFGSSISTLDALLMSFPESLNFSTNAGIAPIMLARQCTSPNKAEIIASLQRGIDYWYDKAGSQNQSMDSTNIETVIEEDEQYSESDEDKALSITG